MCMQLYICQRTNSLGEEKIRGDRHAFGVEGCGACDRPALGNVLVAWPLGTQGALVLQLTLAPAGVSLVCWFHGLYLRQVFQFTFHKII